MNANFITGWSILDKNAQPVEGIWIGRMPDVRRSWALWHDAPGRCTPLAYFRDEESAHIAGRLLDAMLNRR